MYEGAGEDASKLRYEREKFRTNVSSCAILICISENGFEFRSSFQPIPARTAYAPTLRRRSSFNKMRFFTAFGFLALISRSGCLPMDTISGLSWPGGPPGAAAFMRVKKEGNVIGHLEECSVVDSWRERPGFINVLAFLDASWEYSHRQATMLKMLQGRLERSGITGVKFFVINSAKAEAAVSYADVEDEREAWGAAESAQYREFSGIGRTREELKKRIDPDIAFIQDSDGLKIWEKLDASRDQVIVIDKCGRLTYRVIVPWSILHFPYVKAAILSTYKEQPCGGCDLETTTVTHGTESATEPNPDLVLNNWNIDEMKEIAVKKYNLDQIDNAVKKVHHGTEAHDIPENVLRLLNGTAIVKQGKANADSNSSTTHGPLMSAGDSVFDHSYAGGYSHAPNLTEDDIGDNEQENPLAFGDGLNIDESMYSRNDSDTTSTIFTETTEIPEFTTFRSIEDERSNGTEQTYYLGDDHEADDSGFTESYDPNNTWKYYGEERNDHEGKNGSWAYDISDSEGLNDSVSSSSEETGNRIDKAAPASGESDSDERFESSDYVMPIRIIMHAPHVHRSEKPMEKHEYLVLKIGSPEYHGHLEYDDPSAPKEMEAFGTVYDRSTGEEDDRVGLGSEEGGNSHRRKGHRHGKGKDLRDVVYGKDESPGFYGEDVEYWRSSGSGYYLKKVGLEPPANEGEHGESKEEQTERYEAANITEASRDDTTIEESTTKYYENLQAIVEHHGTSEDMVQEEQFTVNNTTNSKEEDIEDKLFLHYSKLFPWLDYVIDE